jgi:hypothetical protein
MLTLASLLAPAVLDFDARPGDVPAKPFAAPAAGAAGAGAGAFSLVAGVEAGGHLPSWPVHLSMCGHDTQGRCAARLPGQFVGEAWSSTKSRSIDNGRGIAVIGSSRVFFAKPGAASNTVKQWYDVKYEKLFLLGRSLSFDLDLSGVGCGCNAAVRADTHAATTPARVPAHAAASTRHPHKLRTHYARTHARAHMNYMRRRVRRLNHTCAVPPRQPSVASR